MGLREIIAGKLGTVEWTTVTDFLRANYKDNELETARRSDAAKRDELIENRGEQYIAELVDDVFEDDFNKDVRKKFIKRAKYNNFIKRIVHEKATVYSEPAKRTLANGSEKYAELAELCQLDEVMRQLNRKLVLHEDVWVQYRVRKLPGDRREPVIDVVSPALFYAVAHPADATLLVAVILDQKPQYRGAAATDAHYRVWCDDETFLLDSAFRFIAGSWEAWPLGQMPGFLATEVPPATKSRLLAACPNDDLVAAHEAVWLQALLLLKESVSATNTTYASGDVSEAVMGQPSDTGREVVVPEGVSIQSVDRGMDLKQFRENETHIGDTCGANHGVPPSVRHQRDASSGSEIHLRRIPIRELRTQQIPTMRRWERLLAVVMSLVNPIDLPAYVFDVAGFAIDYGEIQQPLTPMESLAVFKEERELLLSDTIAEERRRNPDLKTDEEAWERISQRIEREVRRVTELRALQALDGGVRTGPGSPTPAQNGQAGQAAQRQPSPPPATGEAA